MPRSRDSTAEGEASMARFAGKVVVVSGAAQGRGAATARLFAAEGARTVLGDVLEDKGRATAQEIGDDALFHPLDVRSDASWSALVRSTLARFGTIDVLVNNAAIVHYSAIEDLVAEEAERVLGINVLGVMLGVKHVAPVMKRAGKGVIVNISSVDGLRGCNGLSAYTASKWAVRGLTKSQAYELGPSGIRVCSVHPGGVNTQMGNPDGRDRTELNKDFTRVPLQRIGEPEEIARTTLFIASDDASYITGAEIAVDGGWSAGYFQPELPGTPAGLGV